MSKFQPEETYISPLRLYPKPSTVVSMPRTTSFTLSDELTEYIEERVQSGEYKSASELMRKALERFAEEDRETREICAVLDRALKNSRHAQPGAFKRLRVRHGIGK